MTQRVGIPVALYDRFAAHRLKSEISDDFPQPQPGALPTNDFDPDNNPKP